MSSYQPDQIRNTAIISHRGAGKTSLAEAMLYTAGATDRLGRVDDGNTVADFEPEETARHITISTALCHAQVGDVKVNILDTPGYADFLPDVTVALSVVDSAVLVLDGVAGVEVHTERVYRAAEQMGLPLVAFVNKLDKEHSDFEKAVQSLARGLGCRAVPVFLPVGKEAELRGVVDLLRQKALLYENHKAREVDVPEEMAEAVAAAREQLVEFIAEADDPLLEKYLEGGELSQAELAQGLRTALRQRLFVPVLCGAAYRVVGADALLGFICQACPSPADAPGRQARRVGVAASSSTETEQIRRGSGDAGLAAVVFKSIADPYIGRLNLFRVYSGTVKSDSTAYNASKGQRERVGQLVVLQGKSQQAVEAVGPGDMGAVAKLNVTTTGDTLCEEQHQVVFDQLAKVEGMYSRSARAPSRADEEKLSEAVSRLAEEDIAFSYMRDQETGELVISGMGQLHLDIAMERLKRKFNVNVDLGEPKIAYRETIRRPADATARHKKQTGGRGQFGECSVKIEPLGRGEGFEFVNAIKGASIPGQYVPAVEKGIVDAMREGATAGYPVVDVKATVYDGKHHPVDSSELAFRIAGSMAFKRAAEEAEPVLLEPIVELEVQTPEEFVGDIISDLNGKRGRVLGTVPVGTTHVIQAQVPLAEVLSYEAQLRSMTQGRASHTLKPSHYEEVPAHLAQRIVAERQREQEQPS